MKTLSLVCSLAFVNALYGLPVEAATKSITATATSRSVAQEPIAWFANGVGAVTTYTTTFDGAAGVSRIDSSLGFDRFGEEIRPNDNQPLLFEADYATYSPIYGVVGYGFANFTLPAGDSDGNSILDIFQFEKAATVSYSGVIHPDSPAGANQTTSGTLSKQANQGTIQNSFTSRDTSGNIQAYSATILLSYFRGTGAYSRTTQGQNQLDLTLTGGTGSSDATYNASTSFTVISSDQITIPAFTARRSDGFALNVFALTLTRKANKYIGQFEVSDGNLATTWRDYTKWVLELVDGNDADANGIPDLSDTLPNIPPLVAISAPADNRSFPAGSSIVFQATATDSDGSVVRVEYFAESTLIGSSTIPPFTVNTTTLTAGAHTISAKATDSGGKSTTSSPLNLIVAAKPALAISRNASSLNVSGTATANVLHTLQSSTEGTTWADVNTVMSGFRGGITFSNVSVAGTQRWFRVVVK
jgi:hypothetical protein